MPVESLFPPIHASLNRLTCGSLAETGIRSLRVVEKPRQERTTTDPPQCRTCSGAGSDSSYYNPTP
jgi:hypothetical protein